MTWRLLSALIGLSITGVTAASQQLPRAERLSRDRPPLSRGEPQSIRHAGYFQASGLVRFQLVQGRIHLERSRHRKGSQSRKGDGIYESISVTAQRGIPSVHYVCKTQHQSLQLNVKDARQVKIESRLVDDIDVNFCTIDQPTAGLMTWTLDGPRASRVIQGNTLLHLRNSNPVTFDRHFGALATRMLGGKSLASMTLDTNEYLFRNSQQPASVTVDQIETWIFQLGNASRRKRVGAHQNLVRHGTLVVPVLITALQHHRQEKNLLQPEQIERIDQILGQLDTGMNDRPASLAKLLINDPTYWSTLLPVMDDRQLQIAQCRLESFGINIDWIDAPSSHRSGSRIAAIELEGYSPDSSWR